MQATPDAYDPARIEATTRQFWKARGLPAPSGTIGPPTGPLIHQIIGTIASDANPVALAQGGVLADVDARFFALTGRRSIGRLLVRPSRAEATDPRTTERLADAGAWAAGVGVPLRDPELDAERIQRMVERLAAMGILLRREMPLRSCPRCRVPRTLAGIIYHEEEGPAYLVRFPLAGADPPVSLIVWTDAAWKLLGAPAILAEPDAAYVTVRYRRRDAEERILVGRSSLPRLQAWLPGGEWEVLEESTGRSLDGRPYDHPLGTESPMLARPPPPSGQVHVSDEVTDSGTGFVALVPAHGAADAAASRALDLPGWPVLDRDLALSASFRHKYQGLPVEAGEAFVLRDLREGGYLFAELTVRRGVPRCAVCRTPLVWETGSAWCLEPAALPAARLDLFAGLIPGERSPPSTEVVPWPVSAREPDDHPLTPQLRECPRCHRLSAPSSPAACPCGGESAPQRRRLLPVFREALLAWADESPFPPGESARLYLPARRRVPTLVHHLVAMEAADAHPGAVHATFLATLPSDPALAEWLASSPRDAARAAFVSLTATPRGGAAALVERRAQHALRLRRFWTLSQRVTDTARADRSLGAIAPVAGRASELLDEDRALLSRFERLRRDVTGLYEAGDAAGALHLLEQFFDGPLRSLYLPAAARRLDSQVASERGPVVALLAHVLTTWSELYGPVAPYTAEAVSRLFAGDGRSLFERTLTPILEASIDPAVEARAKSWWSIVEATRRARRHLGMDESIALPQIVLGARDEGQAAELRAGAGAIARLANVTKVEVASPQLPWTGRQLQITPVMPAIQRVFGAGAPRVVRILQGLAPTRVRDGLRSKTLEVAVEGRPVQVTPAMVEVVERLPEGFLTFPWGGSEMIVQAPSQRRGDSAGGPRVVSSDTFRLLRRVRQRIRTSVLPEGVRVVVVCATGGLSDELVRLAPSLAAQLGVPLFRVVASTEGFPLSETTSGRTGRGTPWAIWVPGSRRPAPRPKQRAVRAHQARVRRAARRDPTPEAVVEIQSDPAVRRDAEIGRWVTQLDELVGRPLVGPAKLRAAWDAGFQQYDDLVHAPFDQLAAVAGFGPFVAAELIGRAGGEIPPRARFRLTPAAPPAAPATNAPRRIDPDLGPSAPAPSNIRPDDLRALAQPISSEPPSPLVRSSLGGTTLVVPASAASERVEPVSGRPEVTPPAATPVLPSAPESSESAALPTATEPSREVPSGGEESAALRAPVASESVVPVVADGLISKVPAEEPILGAPDASELDSATAPADPAQPVAPALDLPHVPPGSDVAASLKAPVDTPPSPSPPAATTAPPEEPVPVPPAESEPPSPDAAPNPAPVSTNALSAVPEPTVGQLAEGQSREPRVDEHEVGPPVEPVADANAPFDTSSTPPAAEVSAPFVNSPDPEAASIAGEPASPASPAPELPTLAGPAPGESILAPAAPAPPESILSVPPPVPSESERPVPPVGEDSTPEVPPESAGADSLQDPELAGSEPTGFGSEPAPAPPEPTPTGEAPAADQLPPAGELLAVGAPTADAPVSVEVPGPADVTAPVVREGNELSSPFAPATEDTLQDPSPEAPGPAAAPPTLPTDPRVDATAPSRVGDDSPPTAATAEERIPDESIPEIQIVETAVPPSPAATPVEAPIEPAPDAEATLTPGSVPPESLSGDLPESSADPSSAIDPPSDSPAIAESLAPTSTEAPEPPPNAEAPLEARERPLSVPADGAPDTPDALATLPAVTASSPIEPAGPVAPAAPELPSPALVAPMDPAPSPPSPPSGLAVSSAALANDAWPIFLDATAAGHRGLCVSREFPDRMRALLGPRDVTVVWLSNTSRPGSVRPTDLEALVRLVEDALSAQNVRAIYLDHVEYLARVNSVPAVRACLDRIDAAAHAHEARVWVALNPQLLSAEAAEALAKGFPSAH